MGKKGKFMGKRKRDMFKSNHPKKKKHTEDQEPVNKKALFNRYKNKQKVEEEIAKKKLLDRKLLQQRVDYSESEEEENTYEQLVSCFSKTKSVAVVSESEESDDSSHSEPVNKDDVDGGDPAGPEHHCDSSPEPESDSDNSVEEKHELNDDDSELQDTPDDPFVKHLQYDLSDELLVSLASSPPTVEQVSKNWPVLGDLSITIPKPLTTTVSKVQPKISLLEEKIYASPGTVPTLITTVDFDKLYIKPQIQGNIVSANKQNLIKNDLELSEVFTPLQRELFSIINNYQDLYYPGRSFTNAEEIRYIYCLHAVNHMLKTRTKILHHNAKLAKKTDVNEDYQDQGLVRPKVLILVPFKDAAYRVVKTIIDILVPKEAGQVVNKNRFEQDFTGGGIAMPKKNPKPEDYEQLFSGNTDDTFRLGMTVTKKTLKLYTEFYSSDVIVASPLGLRLALGAAGEPDRDYDFLASIELLVLDQADVCYMQNWEHVLHVFDHLHLQPTKTHGTDYSRVRSWAVNGWAKYYRQTLLFSSVGLPALSAVLHRRCLSRAGRVSVRPAPPAPAARHLVLQVPQLFHRFSTASPQAAAEDRFQHFAAALLPRLRAAPHALLYVPSYFDYVRLRNHFKHEDIGFVQICEYSKDAKIARARDMFFHSEAPLLLYSERAHFFRRLRVKGVRHLVFYQPPTYPHFYAEMCNLMQESNQNKYGGSDLDMSVSTLYCRYDVPALAGVLGAPRAAAAAAADQPLHLYVTSG